MINTSSIRRILTRLRGRDAAGPKCSERGQTLFGGEAHGGVHDEQADDEGEKGECGEIEMEAVRQACEISAFGSLREDAIPAVRGGAPRPSAPGWSKSRDSCPGLSRRSCATPISTIEHIRCQRRSAIASGGSALGRRTSITDIVLAALPRRESVSLETKRLPRRQQKGHASSSVAPSSAGADVRGHRHGLDPQQAIAAAHRSRIMPSRTGETRTP